MSIITSCPRKPCSMVAWSLRCLPFGGIRSAIYRRCHCRRKVYRLAWCSYSFSRCPCWGWLAKKERRECWREFFEVRLTDFNSYVRKLISYSYLSHSRTGIAAGSPVPIDLMKSLISKLNLKDLTNAYGMSVLLFFGLLFFFCIVMNRLQPRLAQFLSKLRPQTLLLNASRQWEKSNRTSRPSLLIPRVKSWTWVLQARSAFLDTYYKRGEWLPLVFVSTKTVMEMVGIGTTKRKRKAWWKRISKEHYGCIREMKVLWTRKATCKVKFPIKIR